MRIDQLPRRLREVAREWGARVAWKKQDATTVEAGYRDTLEELYLAPDPFRMASPKEQFRFAKTDRIMRDQMIAPAEGVGSILEIGCGEGHQSALLSSICRNLTGIDVISAAVERAKLRLPHATFIAGDVREQSWTNDRARFDIVTACEVIYCFHDVPGMLQIMSRLGRQCLVTYHRPAAHLVERPLKAMPLGGTAEFAFENVEWRCAWWRSD